MTTVHLMRTHWAHWGAHTGFNQFLKHLTPSRVTVREQQVLDGNRRWKSLNAMARPLVSRMTSDYYKLTDLIAEIQALREVMAYKPDILHFLDADLSAQLLPRLGAITRRTRTIASYHQPPDILRRIVSPALARRFDQVITVSSDQANLFDSWVEPGRIAVIPLGIDTDFFRPATQAPSLNGFRCLTVGFWLRDFELLARLVKRMAGSGVEFHIVAPEIGNLPLTPDIVWHRNISDDALVALYQSAHSLLLPLKAATANNALLEGMACGLPILSTRLPAVEEYLGGAEAILASPDDEEAFVDGIDRLRADADLRQRLALASRRRAEQLDWRCVASQTSGCTKA